MKTLLFICMLFVHITAALLFLPLLIVTILFHWLLAKGIDAGNQIEITMPSFKRKGVK